MSEHIKKEYNGWPLLDVMPDGWSVDNTAGTPLSGYIFITNRKSVLNGQLRALLRVRTANEEVSKDHSFSNKKPINNQNDTPKPTDNAIDLHYAVTVNKLAREKFKQRILEDILVDLQICEIEGWSKSEYLNELKQLIGNLGVTK